MFSYCISQNLCYRLSSLTRHKCNQLNNLFGTFPRSQRLRGHMFLWISLKKGNRFCLFIWGPHRVFLKKKKYWKFRDTVPSSITNEKKKVLKISWHCPFIYHEWKNLRYKQWGCTKLNTVLHSELNNLVVKY